MKKVLVTGTFDLIHPGHIWFLKHAKKHGDHLTVIIARDRTVEQVKKHPPFYGERVRLRNIQKISFVDHAALGNVKDKMGSVKKMRPDTIVLGYDQHAFTQNLATELAKRGVRPKILRAKSYFPKKYKSTILRDAALVDLASFDHSLVIDIPYATRHNFVGKRLYSAPRALLHHRVAKRLKRVHQLLKRQGYRIKIWDTYRPLSIQKILWQKKSDPRYVMDPQIGSNHNRAAAVDCTLVDREGHELVMPTAYDEFSTKAHRTSLHMSPVQKKNMLILERAMRKVGFIPMPTEWWHFTDPEWKKFPILNIPI